MLLSRPWEAPVREKASTTWLRSTLLMELTKA